MRLFYWIGIMARPKKDEEKIVRLLKEAFLLDFNKYQACIYAECSRDYLHKLEIRRPALKDVFKQCKESVKMKARKAVSDAIPNDPKIALSYLKLRDKGFKGTLDINHSGKINFGDKFLELLDKATNELNKIKVK
jgi:G:T/U-mismatch repair DNA glycosylase